MGGGVPEQQEEAFVRLFFQSEVADAGEQGVVELALVETLAMVGEVLFDGVFAAAGHCLAEGVELVGAWLLVDGDRHRCSNLNDNKTHIYGIQLHRTRSFITPHPPPHHCYSVQIHELSLHGIGE